MEAHLVTPEWLVERLGEPDLVALDCTWFVPEMRISGRDLFQKEHIPGARFIDLDDISDPTSPYVNMMPSAERFAAEVGRLGIGSATRVVVYNSNYVSARLWWMFRHFGHDDVFILDGGLQRWKNMGYPLDSGPARPASPVAYRIDRSDADIAEAADVMAALRDRSATVIDVRPKGKFDGTEPTGYPGVAPGHMPGALNLPWSRLFTANPERRFIGNEEFRTLLRDAGADLDKPIIATCGSGVTAAILAFHLTRMRRRDWRIYDGSWHEWGQRDDLPKVTTLDAEY